MDLDRRTFFRTFGRSAVEAAGQAVGAADMLRRGAAAMAGGLLGSDGSTDTGTESDTRPGSRSGTLTSPLGTTSRIPGEGASYRSPYRLVDDTLVIVDQRALPESIVELTCHDGRDVARAIGSGAARGAPLLGQLAAYGMSLTAHRHRERRSGALRVALESTETQLRGAARTVRPVGAALDRLSARRAAWADGSSVDVLADLLRAEADAIASEAMSDHAALARHGAAALPRPEGRALEILVHGETGAMGSGLVGTGLAIVQLLMAEERPVHVWVTEARPSLEGGRIAAWELGQAGVAHTVIADSAIAWLITRRTPDVILLGATWLAANGDAAVLIGGAAAAILAGTLVTPPVPVLLCAPLTTFDAQTAHGGLVPDEQRIQRVLSDGATRSESAASTRSLRGPAVDIVEARWLAAIATEEGVLGAPFGPALAAAARSRAARRQPTASSVETST